MNILVLGMADPANAETVIEHLCSFQSFPCSTYIINNTDFLTKRTLFIPPYFDLDYFDVLIIHYSVYVMEEDIDYLTEYEKRRISDFNGLKVMLRQDEYYKVNNFHSVLLKLKIDLLLTCVPENEIDKVYPKHKLPNLHIINTLTGYISKRMLGANTPLIKDRSLDVVYRGRDLPYWYGELAQEKRKICVRFAEDAKRFNLNTDLSVKEEDRIYGDNWTEFLTSSKATLGTESGASIFDFTGELLYAYEDYIKSGVHIPFEEYQKRYLLPYENKIKLNQISPRCFEAICLRTVLVLYEGDYSGLLKPWQHYIPLKKDHSNIEDVVKALSDDTLLQEISDRAYNEVALSQELSYEHFALNLYDAISNLALEKKLEPKHKKAINNNIVSSFKDGYISNTTLLMYDNTENDLFNYLEHMEIEGKKVDEILCICDKSIYETYDISNIVSTEYAEYIGKKKLMKMLIRLPFPLNLLSVLYSAELIMRISGRFLRRVFRFRSLPPKRLFVKASTFLHLVNMVDTVPRNIYTSDISAVIALLLNGITLDDKEITTVSYNIDNNITERIATALLAVRKS